MPGEGVRFQVTGAPSQVGTAANEGVDEVGRDAYSPRKSGEKGKMLGWGCFSGPPWHTGGGQQIVTK